MSNLILKNDLTKKYANYFMVASLVFLPVNVMTAAHAKKIVSTQAPVTKLNNLLAPLNSLQAEFTQETSVAKQKSSVKQRSGMAGLKTSSMNKRFKGTMIVKRPNMFYWHTKQPAEQKIIADGKNVWIYDPDLEQATQQKIDKQIANTPALLLSGNTEEIKRNFNVTQPKKDIETFVLYPKNENAVFEHLALAFKNGKPRAMVLNDSLGQQTVITFNKLKINTKIPNQRFQFKVPKGVDVIKQ